MASFLQPPVWTSPDQDQTSVSRGLLWGLLQLSSFVGVQPGWESLRVEGQLPLPSSQDQPINMGSFMLIFLCAKHKIVRMSHEGRLVVTTPKSLRESDAQGWFCCMKGLPPLLLYPSLSFCCFFHLK